MKTHYVYELYNLLGTIEYVGETINPKLRLWFHKSKTGKFHKRTDISMNIVEEFDNKKDAYNYQIELQKQYNLETDIQLCIKGGKSSSTKGKPKSAEHKLKISLAQKGISKSVEHTLKIKEGAIRRWNSDKS